MTSNISWIYDGAGELIDASGSGIDFVRFGGSTVPPQDGSSWTGQAPTPSSDGTHLGRDANSTDTDDGNDWCNQSASLGSQNVGCGGGGDSYEPDDDSTGANPISNGETQTHSIEPVGDQDWVTFTLANQSSVTLETIGQSGDTRMWLFDSNLNQVEYDNDDGTNAFSFIDRTCGVDSLSAGTYYVKVDEYGGNNTIPEYQLSFQAAECPPPDIIEARSTLRRSMMGG